MTNAEFGQHMERLIQQFGKASYSKVRTDLIWEEVKELSSSWWKKTVDKFLLACRQAPLFDELAPEIDIERERIWKIEKEKRSSGSVDQIMDQLKAAAFECLECSGTGIIWHFDAWTDQYFQCERKNLYLYRCGCPQGRKRQEKYPTFQIRGAGAA